MLHMQYSSVTLLPQQPILKDWYRFDHAVLWCRDVIQAGF